MFHTLCIGLAVMGGLLAVGLLLIRTGPDERTRVRSRLAQEFTTEPVGESAVPLFKELDVLTLSSDQEYALLKQRTAPTRTLAGWRSLLESYLHRSNVSITVKRFFLLVMSAALILGLLGAALFRVPGAAIGLLIGLTTPFIWLHIRCGARQELFMRQLPSAFTLMSRVLRSGQTVGQAFNAVGEAFPGPLGSEFIDCQKRQDLGLPLEVVLKEMTTRTGILELRIFFMAITIQRQTGGNLAEMLERLAVMLQGRLRLRQQVRTLTAEGRLQGLTLLVLPFLMFAAMFFVNRTYAESLLQHRPLLIGMAISMTVGILWIRSIVNFQA